MGKKKKKPDNNTVIKLAWIGLGVAAMQPLDTLLKIVDKLLK